MERSLKKISNTPDKLVAMVTPKEPKLTFIDAP